MQINVESLFFSFTNFASVAECYPEWVHDTRGPGAAARDPTQQKTNKLEQLCRGPQPGPRHTWRKIR